MRRLLCTGCVHRVDNGQPSPSFGRCGLSTLVVLGRTRATELPGLARAARGACVGGGLGQGQASPGEAAGAEAGAEQQVPEAGAHENHEAVGSRLLGHAPHLAGEELGDGHAAGVRHGLQRPEGPASGAPAAALVELLEHPQVVPVPRVLSVCGFELITVLDAEQRHGHIQGEIVRRQRVLEAVHIQPVRRLPGPFKVPLLSECVAVRRAQLLSSVSRYGCQDIAEYKKDSRWK
mmetsp:Transcript_104179/g.335986  ORF Transcript_104179/g.335986 Transcript_104179/m.335986 type:complete len:234 (+) Transcript_104179:172-873(+)